MLSERQAWLKMAKRIDEGANDFLCNCLRHPDISDVTRSVIMVKIQDRVRRNRRFMGENCVCAWTIDAAGRKKRIAFCLAQAKKLERKRVAKRKQRGKIKA